MLSSLSPALLGHYGSSGGLQLKPLSSLQPGRNPGCIVLGRVVFSLTPEERVPFTFGLVDADGSCYSVMVYNMVESWGVLIGDSVAVPEPQLKHHHIQHKGKVRPAGYLTLLYCPRVRSARHISYCSIPALLFLCPSCPALPKPHLCNA
ncbi:hypothetical protein FKM82_018438 [Ascaphus truei]